MLNSHYPRCSISLSLLVFCVSSYADLCLAGPLTRSNPDENSDQQVVRRGPTGALRLRGRRGWNRTSVNTFISHESENLLWIYWFQPHEGVGDEFQLDHAGISTSHESMSSWLNWFKVEINRDVWRRIWAQKQYKRTLFGYFSFLFLVV